MPDTITLPVKRGRSVTGPQVLIRPMNLGTATKPVLSATYPTNWMTKVRTMRKDATIAMVRQLVIAPALMAPWQYVGNKDAPEDAVEFIKEQFDELRTYIIRTVLFGCIDFGWAPFEKVFAKQDDGKVALQKLKSLLQDYTEILVNERTGAFAGLRQTDTYGSEIILSVGKSWFHSFDVEGTYWYGKGWMENAEDPYDQWTITNDANERYDTKIAGSHWVVHYPIGVSTVNNVETNNEVIAQTILNSLQSSGGIAVPKKMEEFITELDKDTPNAWEIELISDTGATQVGFIDRMSYLDKLKVRALGFPERSILEGKYGTKAESETHADFAVSNILMRNYDILRDLNWHLVDPILGANYGPDAMGTVRITSGSIGEENKRFLRDVYMKLIGDSKGFLSEMSRMDLTALRTVLNVPQDPDRVDEEEPFEELYDKMLEDQENGVFEQDGFGDDVREDQRGEVGRPEQQRSIGRDQQPGLMGDRSSRRANRRPPEEQ